MQPAGLDAYIFPGQNRGQAHMAEKTVCTALRTVSGVDDVTAHGTRSLISGFCYEAGYRSEVIEAQLSHAVGTIARERNESVAAVSPAVRQAYLRSPFLELRTRMMQHWADSLDAMKQASRCRRTSRA